MISLQDLSGAWGRQSLRRWGRWRGSGHWYFRKAIAIDSTYFYPDQVNSGYCIPLTFTNANLDFSKVQSDARDLRFVVGSQIWPCASDKYLKAWTDTSMWDQASSQGLVFVRLDTSYEATPHLIYMYYGNPLASAQWSPVEEVFTYGSDFNTAFDATPTATFDNFSGLNLVHCYASIGQAGTTPTFSYDNPSSILYFAAQTTAHYRVLFDSAASVVKSAYAADKEGVWTIWTGNVLPGTAAKTHPDVIAYGDSVFLVVAVDSAGTADDGIYLYRALATNCTTGFARQARILAGQSGGIPNGWEATVKTPCIAYDSTDSKWYLYYSGQSAGNVRRIGRASSTSLYGPYTRYDSSGYSIPVVKPSIETAAPVNSWPATMDSVYVSLEDMIHSGSHWIMSYGCAPSGTTVVGGGAICTTATLAGTWGRYVPVSQRVDSSGGYYVSRGGLAFGYDGGYFGLTYQPYSPADSFAFLFYPRLFQPSNFPTKFEYLRSGEQVTTSYTRQVRGTSRFPHFWASGGIAYIEPSQEGGHPNNAATVAAISWHDSLRTPVLVTRLKHENLTSQHSATINAFFALANDTVRNSISPLNVRDSTTKQNVNDGLPIVPGGFNVHIIPDSGSGSSFASTYRQRMFSAGTAGQPGTNTGPINQAPYKDLTTGWTSYCLMVPPVSTDSMRFMVDGYNQNLGWYNSSSGTIKASYLKAVFGQTESGGSTLGRAGMGGRLAVDYFGLASYPPTVTVSAQETLGVAGTYTLLDSILPSAGDGFLVHSGSDTTWANHCPLNQASANDVTGVTAADNGATSRYFTYATPGTNLCYEGVYCLPFNTASSAFYPLWDLRSVATCSLIFPTVGAYSRGSAFLSTDSVKVLKYTPSGSTPLTTTTASRFSAFGATRYGAWKVTQYSSATRIAVSLDPALLMKGYDTYLALVVNPYVTSCTDPRPIASSNKTFYIRPYTQESGSANRPYLKVTFNAP